jgi:hypothetical protein
MRKQEILKSIIENPEFREKYWPKFKINSEIQDYNYVIIIKSNNQFLIALYNLIIENDTPNILYKKILKSFEL